MPNFTPCSADDHGISERSDGSDFHLDDITLVHEDGRIARGTDTPRRAGDDHIAGHELDEGGAVLDELGETMHQQAALEFCITSPFSRVVISISSRSPISSTVIIQGPKPPVAVKFLPGVNCDVWR